jgi:hypothetical protein
MTTDSNQSERTGGNIAVVDWAVDPEQIRVWLDEFHVLHVEVDGVVHSDVKPRHVFPLSKHGDYLSFIGEKEVEVALVRNASRIDPNSMAALDEVMGKTYYRARILRIDSIAEAMGVSMWEAHTDRGYAKFEVVDRQRHIRILPGGRFLITDADGNRFEIPCIYELDERSQRLVETET